MQQKDSAVLMVTCPDQQGLVAALAGFVHQHHGNIIHLDQHVDLQANVFFARMEWELEGFTIPHAELPAHLDALTRPLRMQWQLHYTRQRARMAIMVSQQAHCLYDILARHEAGEWPVELALVISNHETLRPLVERLGIPFHHFPITPENAATQEARELALLRTHHIGLVVLARYMRILGPPFVQAFPNAIINIHHSFLPAFPGARPYHSAYARGVKIIGATSHYVTDRLDEGPIIEQDVIRVTHKHMVDDLMRLGRDLEKAVLARAIYWHLHKKILVYNNKTVIFD